MGRYSFVSRGRVLSGRKLQETLHRKKKLFEKWRKANAKRAKKYWTPSQRKKQAMRLEIVREAPGYHEQLSIAMRKHNWKNRKRFDIGKFWKGRKQPAKTRMKRSRAIKKMLKAGKFKIWNKGKHLSARHKEKLRISNLKTYESMILRQKIDRIMTAWWREHPNIRKEVSEKAKRMFISHPERFKKFMKNGKNPFSAKIRTKNGFFVRSKGEKEIANFLFENEIKAEYESKTLIFEKEGQICVPDFWLPRYKIYIEFYGGYPGAWKKKVMKNKLYKKYKIPCIFITPNELRNLNYYLRGELSAG